MPSDPSSFAHFDPANANASSSICVVRYDATICETTPRSAGRICAAMSRRSVTRSMVQPTEKRRLSSHWCCQDELTHLVDRLDAVHVALALRHAPRKQSVAARINPSQPGFSFTARSISSASSNPGRCQGTQTILRPNCRLNSSILRLPLALAARAIAQSGCRWST